MVTPKSGFSLGAKIQSKATEVQPRTPVRRRGSDNSLLPANFVNNVSSPTSTPSPASSLASPYTNRTLFLRQQSARAKRDSLENSTVTEGGLSKKTGPLNGILKKPATSLVNKDTKPLNQSNAVKRSPVQQSAQVSRSSSRNTSPYSSLNSFSQQSSPLMTSSLNLPSGGVLPGEQPRASFQRRKNYDAVKAVEMDRQRRLLKQSTSLMMQQSVSRNSVASTENDNSNHMDDDSMSDSSQSFTVPMQNLKANVSNKQVILDLISIQCIDQMIIDFNLAWTMVCSHLKSCHNFKLNLKKIRSSNLWMSEEI